MDRSVLAQTVREQRELFEKAETWVPRRVPPSFLRTKKITAITGVRRCGKSTLLKQLARDFPGYYYLNFEDERLHLSSKELDLILQAYQESASRGL